MVDKLSKHELDIIKYEIKQQKNFIPIDKIAFGYDGFYNIYRIGIVKDNRQLIIDYKPDKDINYELINKQLQELKLQINEGK